MNAAIVGCGLIGRKRAGALGSVRLTACADAEPERAAALAAQWPGCRATADWRAAVEDRTVDIVIVAVPHHALAEVARTALEAGKHVLVEKPGARSVEELAPVIVAAGRAAKTVRVGFNHRYHRALRQARQIVDENGIGELMFLRGRYGHGGRPGYEKEWRADPVLSGGGELIDQGVHMIDLARWFLGDFVRTEGFARTYFWDMPVDDNAFLLLRTSSERAAFLHVSCTEWKNLFSLEIYGRTGKLHAEGLGGSYGLERLSWYRMLPAMGPPQTTIWEYPMADDSWDVEFAEFLEDIRLGRQPAAGLDDAKAALAVVGAIYQLSRGGRK